MVTAVSKSLQSCLLSARVEGTGSCRKRKDTLLWRQKPLPFKPQIGWVFFNNLVERKQAMVPLSHYLILSVILFFIGVWGVFTRRNAIVIFMCIELMLNAANLAFITFSRYLDSLDGQVFVFFVMTVAAAEAAVGLGIIIALYRNRETLNVDDINLMKW